MGREQITIKNTVYCICILLLGIFLASGTQNQTTNKHTLTNESNPSSKSETNVIINGTKGEIREFNQNTDKDIKASDRTRKIDLNNEIININTCSKYELMKLKGIGEKKAVEIIKNRPYDNIYGLLEKNIIGTIAFNKIQDNIKASD
ncbi:MAG: ComEA family DNA-binding protein [Cetobacterium sp.]|uniref:ComEA family DNA-binding protein n=1 Tax=Cetobacterium sp. TaxID=2071632 RepID=UPI003F3BD9D5